MFQLPDRTSGNIKYVSTSRAVVIDNADPLKRGRVRVNSPVLGETGWINYLTSPGMFSVPEPGDIVYIECDGGSYTHPIAWGNVNKGKDNDLQFPDTFQRIKPTNRGLYSPEGHLFEIDDGSNLLGTDRGIRITGSQGTKFHIKEEITDNSVNFEMPNGATFKIDGTTDAITAGVSFGDNWELSALNGFQVSTPAAGGTTLSMKTGKVDFTSTLGFSVINSVGDLLLESSAGAVLKLANGQVGLGGPAGELVDQASQLADQLNQLATADSVHIHPTAVGPTAVPTNSATMITIASTAAAIKAILDLIKGGI